MRLRSKKLSSSYLTSKVVTRNIPQTPEPVENGMLIPALDRQGWIWLCKDHITQAYTDYAAQTKGMMLEIGAGYRHKGLEVLGSGAKDIANDISKDQRETI